MGSKITKAHPLTTVPGCLAKYVYFEMEAHFLPPVGSNIALQRQRIHLYHNKCEERSAVNNEVAVGISRRDLIGVPLGHKLNSSRRRQAICGFFVVTVPTH